MITCLIKPKYAAKKWKMLFVSILRKTFHATIFDCWLDLEGQTNNKYDDMLSTNQNACYNPII